MGQMTQFAWDVGTGPGLTLAESEISRFAPNKRVAREEGCGKSICRYSLGESASAIAGFEGCPSPEGRAIAALPRLGVWLTHADLTCAENAN